MALSPTGVSISEALFRKPNVFWKAFLDAFGAALWIAHGIGWAWLALCVLATGLASRVARRRGRGASPYGAVASSARGNGKGSTG